MNASDALIIFAIVGNLTCIVLLLVKCPAKVPACGKPKTMVFILRKIRTEPANESKKP